MQGNTNQIQWKTQQFELLARIDLAAIWWRFVAAGGWPRGEGWSTNSSTSSPASRTRTECAGMQLDLKQMQLNTFVSIAQNIPDINIIRQ